MNEGRSRGRRPATEATRRTRARYDRIAPVDGWTDAGAEAARFRRWRALLWGRVRGPRVLELGVGTGKPVPCHPPGMAVTGIDRAPRMIGRATARAIRDGATVDLQLADARALPFPDECFATVVATFVVRSVPDAVRGLRETGRVLTPDGQLLLEHVLSHRAVLGAPVRPANPLVVRIAGANINRDPLGYVGRAGVVVRQTTDRLGDIAELIEAAQPPETGG